MAGHFLSRLRRKREPQMSTGDDVPLAVQPLNASSMTMRNKPATAVAWQRTATAVARRCARGSASRDYCLEAFRPVTRDTANSSKHRPPPLASVIAELDQPEGAGCLPVVRGHERPACSLRRSKQRDEPNCRGRFERAARPAQACARGRRERRACLAGVRRRGSARAHRGLAVSVVQRPPHRAAPPPLLRLAVQRAIRRHDGAVYALSLP